MSSVIGRGLYGDGGRSEIGDVTLDRLTDGLPRLLEHIHTYTILKSQISSGTHSYIYDT